MKNRLAEDHKTISTLLKQKDPVEALYAFYLSQQAYKSSFQLPFPQPQFEKLLFEMQISLIYL